MKGYNTLNLSSKTVFKAIGWLDGMKLGVTNGLVGMVVLASCTLSDLQMTLKHVLDFNFLRKKSAISLE